VRKFAPPWPDIKAPSFIVQPSDIDAMSLPIQATI